MKKTLQLLLTLLLCFACAVTCLTVTGCDNNDAADSKIYTVTYNLNYDTNVTRTESVPSGGKAVDWQPYREGFVLENWYTASDCTGTPFDFGQGISSDITLYAKWVPEKGHVSVMFDANYAGAGYPKTISVREGSCIESEKVPDVARLGMKVTGWYKDADCTDPWDFSQDTVSRNMTLYAKQVFDDSVKRDENGNVIYEDITVNVWLWSDFGTASVIEEIAKAFNADETYKGKIKINVSRQLTSQDMFSLRYSQTTAKNKTNSAYYSAADVYHLAGLDYSPSLWFEKGTRDSYVDGQLYSIPVVAGVPYLVYNTELMKKYNGDNPLPSNFTEFSALMKKVYEGEHAKNGNFVSIMSNRSWTYTEAPGYASFMQNGAPYWTLKNGEYVNEWDDAAVAEKAGTAFENLYAIFGKDGDCHGSLYPEGGAYTEDYITSAVSKGNALFGQLNWSRYAPPQKSNIGIMPLSGLYSDDAATKDLIPVHSLGFAFYRAEYVDHTQLAAAAVFADYVAKQSYKFAERGWYPLYKDATKNAAFVGSTNATVAALRQMGNPENFCTLEGRTNGKVLITETVSAKVLLRMIDGDGKKLRDLVDSTRGVISANLI